MTKKALLFFALSLVLFSCFKETLDPVNLKKVVLFQVDYKTYTFEGGKEFSYFKNDTSTVQLPLSIDYVSPTPLGNMTVKYISDTLFDGTMIWSGEGKVNYPQNIDEAIYYKKIINGGVLTQPADSRFQVLFYDLGSEPIRYDSIWGALSRLEMVERYQSKNAQAKIGLFLYRPTDGVATNPGNWKWYVVMKN